MTVQLIPADTFSGSTPGQRSILTLNDAAPALPAGPPVTGTWRPVNPLAPFVGLDINGTSTLTIGDDVGLDALSFHSWTLRAEITSDDPPPPPVPAPAALALLGVGLAALGLRRRA